jgi:hypothetical protein
MSWPKGFIPAGSAVPLLFREEVGERNGDKVSDNEGDKNQRDKNNIKGELPS